MKNRAVLLVAMLSLQSVAHSANHQCQQIFASNSPSPAASQSELVLLRDTNTSIADIKVLRGDREFFNRYGGIPLVDPALIATMATRQLESLNMINETARSTQKEVAKLKRESEVDTVLYMASGFDGSSPFLVFDSARTVFAVDQHPFVKDPSLPIRLRIPDDGNRGYTLVSTVNDQAQSLASVILWRLSHSIQNFRLIRVAAFTDPTTTTTMGRLAQHGLIEFDSGPGTQVRQYIHIDADIGSEYRPGHQPWWLGRILRHGIDGLLVKGAMSVYANASRTDIESPSRDVTRHLIKNGGILVDGDTTPTWPWELSPASYPNVRVSHTQIENFGYSVVKIVDLKPEGASTR